MYGGNCTRRRVAALTGACLAAGALALGGAGAALAQAPTPTPTPLPDPQGNNIPTNAVTDHVTFQYNVRGVSGYAGANFINYGGDLGDFLFADGTGGLAIFSLKDPAHPSFVARVLPAALRQPGDTQDRFYEGENMTVDSKRKLVFLSRDPRGFGGALTTGKTGVYIIDVKNPYDPKIITFQSVPAGHTSTCINDCQYLWSVGPYSTGTPGNNPDWFPQPAYSVKRGGVPIWVTDVSDPAHPYTYPTPLDTARFDGQTGYVHSVDVDRNGIAWASGEGGVRGYYTVGTHYDPVQKKTRVATAFDPIPYAGGTTPLVATATDDFFGYFDHNAQHITDKVGNYPAGDLLYVTNENIVACSVAGELKIVSLAGSYNGEGWNSTQANPFRLGLVGHWTPWGKPGSGTTGSCSAHWFTTNGNMIAQAWYGQGTRFIDVSDPANPTQAGYFRVPSGTTGVTSGSASATLLAQRLRLRRRLQPRHRHPEVRRHGHRHAQRHLLGQLRGREGHLHRHVRRHRRRHGAGDAEPDARAGGELRPVHAGCGEALHGLVDRERHLDGRRRAAERGGPVERGDRAPGQRRVQPPVAADGAGAQRGQPEHGVQQRRLLGQPAEPADLDGPGVQ